MKLAGALRHAPPFPALGFIDHYRGSEAFMRKISVFNNVSLDGYFTDASGDMSWAHTFDPEWLEFTNSNASGEGVMLFGRVTYDMMRSFWPTPAAMQQMPEVAARMNGAEKIVFSRTLHEAAWENSRLIREDLVGAVRALKEGSGEDMILMGRGQIISQLTAARHIDSYQIVTVPIVLGGGRTMFEGVPEKQRLRRTDSRAFSNGNVVNWYEAELGG
ncbi:MAG: dihydrofolate reductase family protein [Gemmatimonas sp.]